MSVVSVATSADDRWEDSDSPYARVPAPALRDHAQRLALARFDRDELRSSEREDLAGAVSAVLVDALVTCRTAIETAAAQAVEDFLAAHPDARTALRESNS